eukprot:3344943-Rhodomonas_salina.1
MVLCPVQGPCTNGAYGPSRTRARVLYHLGDAATRTGTRALYHWGSGATIRGARGIPEPRRRG